MKLYPLSIAKLYNAEMGKFIIRLLSDVEKLAINTDINTKISNYWSSLQANADSFKLAIKQISGQKETLELAALDLVRDHKLITLRRQIEVYEYADTAEKKEAYAVATIILNNWKGLEYENYEAETIGIRKLLDTWAEDKYLIYIKALNLHESLDGLQRAADAFDKVFGNRSVAAASKVVYDTKAIRRQMEGNYRSMAEYVLVMAKNDDENETFSKLLDAINNVRHYFADVVARRNGNGDW